MYQKVVSLQKPREVKIIFDFVFPISKDHAQRKFANTGTNIRLSYFQASVIVIMCPIFLK